MSIEVTLTVLDQFIGDQRKWELNIIIKDVVVTIINIKEPYLASAKEWKDFIHERKI